MAIRNIREAGDEILKKKSKEIDDIDEKLQILIDDMIETMHAANGVGLAAVQVGVLKRVVVIDLYDENGPIVLINPKIIKQKGEQIVEEVCLSRPMEVTAVALDRNGNEIKIVAKELLAQAICHELDHLDGELFIDKVMPGTLEIIKPENK